MSDFHPNAKGGFIENTLEGLHFALQRALYADASAAHTGFLQHLDPRVKVAGFLALVVSVALAAKLWLLAAMFALAVTLVAVSSVPIRLVAARTWIGAFLFSGAIALPALFLTPGTALYGLPMTVQGVRTASFLLLRAETAATLMLVLAYTTPWTHILKALRIFRVPVVFVVILGMTCRYILLMLETAHEMFESRKSRTVNRMTPAENRRLAIASAGVLLHKTLHMSNEVYLAMQARGFRGEVYVLDDFAMQARDWCALAAFAALAAVSIAVGR
ncbi:MAG TPA: cobalt ECF transporter T component CbiQ [Bryobacteraceae bacterium]|jgi:cobalt ECF transporter T component CbiQ|nr:cobalt ECF transporter T component CbiQ [Bryobacteraceae bacterium]